MRKLFLSIIFFSAIINSVFGQSDSSLLLKTISKTSISGQWFLAYTYNTYDSLAQFQLKRAYLDIKTKINPTFSVRYTQDIAIDKEGEDAGNIETRMKYMYLKAKLKNMGLIKHSYLEIGMAHRPWVDFDGKINAYRLQDEMFADRNNIINSADLGLSWIGLFGDELDESYQKNVSSAYPGRYGSFALGIYNGGGYSSLEQNSNKTIESRISIRPFPDWMPGMQITHSFAYGMANIPDIQAAFLLNIFALTSESRYHTLHAQYYTGKGGHLEHYISPEGESYGNTGFSVLSEIKIPKTHAAVFSRYDYLESERWGNNTNTLFAGGVAYRFHKSKLAAYFEQSKYETHTENIWELALEIKF
jgi:hypothetical protein